MRYNFSLNCRATGGYLFKKKRHGLSGTAQLSLFRAPIITL